MPLTTSVDLSDYTSKNSATTAPPQVSTPPPAPSDEPTASFTRCPIQPINAASPDTLRDFYVLRKGMPVRRLLPPVALGK